MVYRRRHWSASCAWVLLAFAPLLMGAFRLTVPLEQASTVRPMPWAVGEELEYGVRLGMLPAGTQTLRIVDEMVGDGGAVVYRFESTATPSAWLSKVYTFADHRTSFVRRDDLLPVRYFKDVEDGSYRARYIVEFDRRRDRAAVWKNGEFDRKWDVPSHVHDELSMIYFLRSKSLVVGDKYRYTMFTGRKLVPVEVEVLSLYYYTAPLPLGRLPVFRVRASDGLVVWITADARRVPVKIEAPVKSFGTLVATLRACRGLIEVDDSPDG